jgi:hypothetical protein
MAVEVRQNKSTEQKIADRLRNSGEGSNPNVHTVHGSGPTRVHHNIHHSGSGQDFTLFLDLVSRNPLDC